MQHPMSRSGCSTAAICALAVLAAMLVTASAHAGRMHGSNDLVTVKNYARVQIGSIPSWTSLSTTTPLTVTGSTVMWFYNYRNCTDDLSTALDFQITLVDNSTGAPFANVSTAGMLFTGSCPNAALSPRYLGDLSQANSTDPAELAENQIFWGARFGGNDYATGAAGNITGTAANSIIPRGVGIPVALDDGTRPGAVVIFDSNGTALLCGDVVLIQVPNALTTLSTQGTVCYTLSPPPTQAAAQTPPSARAPPPSPLSSSLPSASSLLAALMAALVLGLALF